MSAPGINPLKLFVGGLSWGTVDAVLYDEFGKYGAIDEAIVVRDKMTGKSRGFGFVRFQEAEDAQRAKEATDGQSLDGRVVRVDFASEKRRAPMTGMNGEGALYGHLGGSSLGGYPGMEMGGAMGYLPGAPYMQDAMAMQQVYPQPMYPGAGAMYGYQPHQLQQQQQYLAMQQYQRSQMQQQQQQQQPHQQQHQGMFGYPQQHQQFQQIGDSKGPEERADGRVDFE